MARHTGIRDGALTDLREILRYVRVFGTKCS